MIAPDVNVLVGALSSAAADHAAMASWLESSVNGNQPVVITPAVATGVLRILTHPRIFTPPHPLPLVLASVDGLLEHPNVSLMGPGPRHWEILGRLCRDLTVGGNLVSDAGHAATAIERGLLWVTKDRDFARFEGLRWTTPV